MFKIKNVHSEMSNVDLKMSWRKRKERVGCALKTSSLAIDIINDK